MTDCIMGEQKLLSELRVTELKQELEKRNLDKNGIKIILTDRLEKALIAEGHDPATYLFRVSDGVASSPTNAKPSSPAMSPAPDVSMENATDEEKTKDIPSENGNGTGAGESHDESAMETEYAEPVKDAGGGDADNLDTSKELTIVDEPPADAAATANDEEMLEDPLIDVPPAESAAPLAKPAVTVTPIAVKAPVQAPAKDEDKEKDIASRSIWVRGLTSATKAADLKVLCTQYGKVVRAKIFTSKKQATSACYGYVTMADVAAAEKAVAALHKTQIKGRTISVEKADRSKVPAVKSTAAAPAKKDTAATSAKRESEKKTADDASKTAKSVSITSEKSHDSKAGAKNADPAASSSQKRADSRGDRKRDDKDARRSSDRRDSERPSKLSDSKREPFRRPPARDPRRDTQRTISAARRFPPSSRGLPSRGSLRGRITRPGDRSGYMSGRRPEALSQRDLLTLMRRKDEEHRRREEQIEKERALERERERIRFEREQLEKERLQLQLQAALQQQKLAAMNSSRTKDTYLPSSHGTSRGRHDYRDSRDTRASKLSSSVHRRSAGDSRRSTADDRSRSRHVGGSERSVASRIERDRSEHKPAPASSRERGRHESYSSSRGHSSSQPAAYSRKDYDRGYTSSRDTGSYSGRGGSSYYGNSRDAYSSTTSRIDRIGSSSGAWGASSSAGYGSSSWQGGSGSAPGHSSSSAWGGRGGSNGWSTYGSGGASSGSMRYDYDKYQQRY